MNNLKEKIPNVSLTDDGKIKYTPEINADIEFNYTEYNFVDSASNPANKYERNIPQSIKVDAECSLDLRGKPCMMKVNEDGEVCICYLNEYNLSKFKDDKNVDILHPNKYSEFYEELLIIRSGFFMIEFPEFYYEIEDSVNGIKHLKISNKPLKYKSEKVYICPFINNLKTLTVDNNTYKYPIITKQDLNVVTLNEAREKCSNIGEGFSVFDYDSLKKLVYLYGLQYETFDSAKSPFGESLTSSPSNLILTEDDVKKWYDTMLNYSPNKDYPGIFNYLRIGTSYPSEYFQPIGAITYTVQTFEFIDGLFLGSQKFIIGKDLPVDTDLSEIDKPYKTFDTPSYLTTAFSGSLYWGEGGEIFPGDTALSNTTYLYGYEPGGYRKYDLFGIYDRTLPVYLYGSFYRPTLLRLGTNYSNDSHYYNDFNKKGFFRVQYKGDVKVYEDSNEFKLIKMRANG